MTLPLNYDLWHEILRTHLRPGPDWHADALSETQLTCWEFCRILQPAMYHHVNLRSFACAISFFTTVSGNTDRHRRLAESVQTLQFSFDLDGDPDDDELDSVPESDSEEELSCEEGPAGVRTDSRYNSVEADAHDNDADTQADTQDDDADDDVDMDSDDEPQDFVDIPVPVHPVLVEFWARFQEALPKLIQLDVFSVCFDHYDPFFLRRLLTYGNLADTLPSSVDKLHLKPLPSQYTLADEDLMLECFAWDLTPWRLDISLIPHIHSLFVTTPSYVVWPPTKRQLKFSMDSWTAQLRCGSNSDLREIVINSGFGDNGESIDWFLRKKLQRHPDFQLLDVFERMRTLGGGLGVQLVWRRSGLRGPVGEPIWKLVRVTEPNLSLREEYFFGNTGKDYRIRWMHINEEEWTDQWKGWYRLQIAPGWPCLY